MRKKRLREKIVALATNILYLDVLRLSNETSKKIVDSAVSLSMKIELDHRLNKMFEEYFGVPYSEEMSDDKKVEFEKIKEEVNQALSTIIIITRGVE